MDIVRVCTHDPLFKVLIFDILDLLGPDSILLCFICGNIYLKFVYVNDPKVLGVVYVHILKLAMTRTL